MFGVRFVQGLGALFNAIRLYTRGSQRLLRGLLSHLRSRGRRGAGSLLVWRSGSRETDSHLNIVSSRPNLFVVVGGDRGRGALDGADGRTAPDRNHPGGDALISHDAPVYRRRPSPAGTYPPT